MDPYNLKKVTKNSYKTAWNKHFVKPTHLQDILWVKHLIPSTEDWCWYTKHREEFGLCE